MATRPPPGSCRVEGLFEGYGRPSAGRVGAIDSGVDSGAAMLLFVTPS